MNFSSLQQIVHEVCPRCICRFTTAKIDVIKSSEENIRLHLTEREVITKQVWEDCTVEKANDNWCTVCFGMFQDLFIKNTVEKVKNEINISKRQFNSYQLFYTIPVQLKVFETLFLQKAEGVLKDVSTTYDTKFILKLVYDPLLNTIMGNERKNESSGLQISLFYKHKDSEELLYPEILKKYRKQKKVKHGPWWKNKKKTFQVNNLDLPSIAEVNSFIEDHKKEELIEKCKSVIISSCEIEVGLKHTSLYVGGRYNKYSRELSQTPWVIDGKRVREHSVEEYIVGPLDSFFGSSDHKFQSSGREDCDVRMLGNGRPFIIEVVDPTKVNFSEEEMKVLEGKINKQTDDVKVTCLQVVGKQKCELLKEGEEKKTKDYIATCRFLTKNHNMGTEKLRELHLLKPFVLNQKTPIRVLHRRTASTRQKTIHNIELVEDVANDDDEFKIKLKTQAGTYVKEFVNGDLSRTTPNLGTLLENPVDIIYLDVHSIDLVWP